MMAVTRSQSCKQRKQPQPHQDTPNEASDTKQPFEQPSQSLRAPSSTRKRRRVSSDQSTHQAPKRARYEDLDSIDSVTTIERWRSDVEKAAMERRTRALRDDSSRSRKRSQSGSVRSVSENSGAYRSVKYTAILEDNGSYMKESPQGISPDSVAICKKLLESPQPRPRDSLFDDDMFKDTCQKVAERNEARILRDITPLIVPSAEILASRGEEKLRHLIEGINERWNNAMPITNTLPKPDYSLGFRRRSFSASQLAKISPWVGDYIAGEPSLFMGTWQMYFPFLTCEVKCSAGDLETADRQNALSSTHAVRGLTELFRAVKRERELHRQILAFSISHDHQAVRIYGHYPEISEQGTEYYRYLIRSFDFTELDGVNRWVAYQFTRNVLDHWMPGHFQRLLSAIDSLPDLDRPLSQHKISQDIRSPGLEHPDIDSACESQPSDALTQEVTPSTSMTQSDAKRLRKEFT
ncbi:hypothetical protein S40288_11669 [Stachybotrys chartarum IBT 40288]|nr:hypothetical protein S40288_11669 [Stachybotrys chartarum IBT 40288]